ncbi:response regulator [Patulibacter americanus]|uniref:response regulator n=1 Tax=Patulibacter americanus TaxID=588672 RepID=UPI001B7FCBFB|nr:response regulator [Patulibacter americanus]
MTRPRPRPSVPCPPNEVQTPTGPVRVVLADDSPFYSAPLVRRMAADPCWTVLRVVENGGDAVLAARELRPDLVVLDVRMPGMGGIEAARVLREDEALEGVRIALMTGDPGRDGVGSASGVDGVVDKAASRREILRRLREIGRRRRPA